MSPLGRVTTSALTQLHGDDLAHLLSRFRAYWSTSKRPANVIHEPNRELSRVVTRCDGSTAIARNCAHGRNYFPAME